MLNKFLGLCITSISAVIGLGLAPNANAALVTHSAKDFTKSLTPPFNQLTEPVGTFFINKGVDYSFGNTEGVFNDPPEALCGINTNNICDLLTAVDGRIVQLNTTNQGFARYLFVEAGFADPGTLTLTAFDINMNIIDQVLNDFPVGPNGRTTMTIDRGNIYNIAFFRVSGFDSYGVNTVRIDIVPEPLTILGVTTGLAFGTFFKRKLSKKQKTDTI